jgi:hypothetical protein
MLIIGLNTLFVSANIGDFRMGIRERDDGNQEIYREKGCHYNI